MGNPYLDELDAKQLALLESTGNKNEDYVKDPSLLGGFAGEQGGPSLPPLVEAEAGKPEDFEMPDFHKEPAPPVDPQADIRSRALKQLMDLKYPERKQDNGLLSAEGAGKASLAFHRAGGGKLKDDFFKPVDHTGDESKKAQFEIQRANAMAGLMGKRAGEGGAGKSSDFLRAVIAEKYPDLVKANPDAFKVADVDELTKAGQVGNTTENRRTRLEQNAIGNTRAERSLVNQEEKEKYRREFEQKKFGIKLDEREQDELQQYDDRNKVHKGAVDLLEQIDVIAPGLPWGIVKPGTKATLSEWNNLKSRIPLGLGGQITPEQDKAIRSRIDLLMYEFQHRLTGSARTDSERADMAKILYDSLGSTPEARAMALDMVRQTVAGHVNSNWAAFADSLPQDKWDRYHDNGGVVGNRGVLAKNAPARPVQSPPSTPDARNIDAQLKGTKWSNTPGQPSQPAPPPADPQRAAAEEWLRANPDHPKAAAVRAKLGMP